MKIALSGLACLCLAIPCLNLDASGLKNEENYGNNCVVGSNVEFDTESHMLICYHPDQDNDSAMALVCKEDKQRVFAYFYLQLFSPKRIYVTDNEVEVGYRFDEDERVYGMWELSRGNTSVSTFDITIIQTFMDNMNKAQKLTYKVHTETGIIHFDYFRSISDAIDDLVERCSEYTYDSETVISIYGPKSTMEIFKSTMNSLYRGE